MPATRLPFEVFVSIFRKSCRERRRDVVERPFALILGAGASRSAGIPTASEMLSALRMLLRASGKRIPTRSPNESEWSWVFRHAVHAVSGGRAFEPLARDFIGECVSRAQGEPNISHLLAAAMTNAGVFRYIVTTNFDDQTLAGFWSVPRGYKGLGYAEPHVIYDPASAGTVTNIAPRVPVVLKAHGHHTTYGLGIVDHDISTLSPQVQQVVQALPKPGHGFLVVGYSGRWDDGVMRALSNPAFTSGKTIYWCFTGKRRPGGAHVSAVTASADVRFVPISSSDELFLQLWNTIEANPSDEYDDRETILRPAELFTFSTAYRDWQPTGNITKDSWWYPPSSWPTTNLGQLRKRLLPKLLAIDKDDRDLTLRESLPDSLKNRFAAAQLDTHTPQLPHAEWHFLNEILPLAVPWTRRNRKVVIRALAAQNDDEVGYRLLHGLTEWGHWPR